jgi:hypothetical protein
MAMHDWEEPSCGAGLYVTLNQEGVTVKTVREGSVTTVVAENWRVRIQAPVFDTQM